MKVEISEIDRLSKLARLEFSQEEKVKLQGNLEEIIGYMDKLKGLDLTEVEPMMRVDESLRQARKDEVKPSLSHEESFKNAPAQNQGHFSIPKTVI